MDQEILNSYSRINHLNVSRETFLDFENYISMIIEKNKRINIISKKTSSKKSIIERHIIDSAQIIDFINFNFFIFANGNLAKVEVEGSNPFARSKSQVISIFFKNFFNRLTIEF